MIALVLLLPLVCLQSLEAASLFCDGLAHANLLSAACPHHTTSPDGEKATGGKDGSGARDSQPSSEEHGEDVAECTCPRTGNSLPDGLILLVLGGVGIPTIATLGPEIWTETGLRRPRPETLGDFNLPHLQEHPPRG